MRKLLALFIQLIASSLIVYSPHTRAEPAETAQEFQKLPGAERIARARAARDAIIRARFQKAGLPYPAREIFLRWFKKEEVIELWARGSRDPFLLVQSYAILAGSGVPGPKRREGDRQVPEGFYAIDRFNPESRFHLSLRIDYPNASDRVLGDPEKPGGDIFIHGSNVSIGCGPIGNDAIEELYLIAIDSRDHGQARIPVHIFPARMSGPDWEPFAAAALAENPVLRRFWEGLRPAYDYFELSRRLPEITVSPDGSYDVEVGH